MGLFGTCVIISGLWRFFSAEGGHAGLWFGLVVGIAAVVGSALFGSQKFLAANLLSWTCLLLVGGWFCYESFIKKGFAESEVRQLIVITITVLTIFWMLTTYPKASSNPQ